MIWLSLTIRWKPSNEPQMVARSRTRCRLVCNSCHVNEPPLGFTPSCQLRLHLYSLLSPPGGCHWQRFLPSAPEIANDGRGLWGFPEWTIFGQRMDTWSEISLQASATKKKHYVCSTSAVLEKSCFFRAGTFVIFFLYYSCEPPR